MPSSLIDVLPSVVLFGIGISCIVAPLTNTLMGSVPGRFSGLGSAINNAISRVGQPLLGAVIFVAISATFYASLAGQLPGIDPAAGDVRAAFPPLNPPRAGASEAAIAAAAQASIDAFHLAMLVGAVMLGIGALVSWVGLRDQDATQAEPTAPSAEAQTA